MGECYEHDLIYGVDGCVAECLACTYEQEADKLRSVLERVVDDLLAGDSPREVAEDIVSFLHTHSRLLDPELEEIESVTAPDFTETEAFEDFLVAYGNLRRACKEKGIKIRRSRKGTKLYVKLDGQHDSLVSHGYSSLRALVLEHFPRARSTSGSRGMGKGSITMRVNP